MTHDVNVALLPRIARQTDSKVLVVVMDGLGGVIDPASPTALERAKKPNFDAWAKEGALGRYVPIAPGITPGSGPGHFSIFGYDPLGLEVGRGVLETLGLGIDVSPGDVTARANFATAAADGRLLDRRAGRIATEEATPLARALAAAVPAVDGVRIEIHPGLQHRFALVLRGAGLCDAVGDTDPQAEGVPSLAPAPLTPAAERTARVVAEFLRRAHAFLAGQTKANHVLLRGFSGRPAMPTLAERAHLRPVAIAAYPAYLGVARLLGMDVEPGVSPKSTVADEVTALEKAWKKPYDFYFLHVKGTDSAGEDGDEDRKARVIEELDRELPRIRALAPDVVLVTGDHSTPGPLKAHSWHPVPFLLHGRWVEPDEQTRFDERACAAGRYGSWFPALSLMPVVLACAGKLAKFGA
ncbi:MAG: 2,3-bisphosphoglycerate-independent phosphoglycerate mutase [Planctomycetes bacterium]|nr:2,3-bisphosphoglycerate-independent phosphoglycerate mutase [Planctomycetota bacterium]